MSDWGRWCTDNHWCFGFAFPHSVYRIDVTNEAGETEKWVLSTEDPRDAERLGFADELRAIKVGDPITVVGWPDRHKEREIRGHQLLECHTQRDDFTMIIVDRNLPAAERAQLDAGTEYISEFNRVLSRWWEQERSSCE